MYNVKRKPKSRIRKDYSKLKFYENPNPLPSRGPKMETKPNLGQELVSFPVYKPLKKYKTDPFGYVANLRSQRTKSPKAPKYQHSAVVNRTPNLQKRK